MADRVADIDDKRLEALFASDPIADDGFSDRVTSRLRRRLWIRGSCLGLAIVLGSLIAFRPLVELLTAAWGLLLDPSGGLISLPADWLPTAHMTVAGGLVFGVLMLAMNLLEE